MAFSLNKLKNFLNSGREGSNQLAGSGSLEPEIGFKLSLHPINKNLYVTVIGARHLPSLFGLSRAHGYLVKVTSFLLYLLYCPSRLTRLTELLPIALLWTKANVNIKLFETIICALSVLNMLLIHY